MVLVGGHHRDGRAARDRADNEDGLVRLASVLLCWGTGAAERRWMMLLARLRLAGGTRWPVLWCCGAMCGAAVASVSLSDRNRLGMRERAGKERALVKF